MYSSSVTLLIITATSLLMSECSPSLVSAARNPSSVRSVRDYAAGHKNAKMAHGRIRSPQAPLHPATKRHAVAATPPFLQWLPGRNFIGAKSADGDFREFHSALEEFIKDSSTTDNRHQDGNNKNSPLEEALTDYIGDIKSLSSSKEAISSRKPYQQFQRPQHGYRGGKYEEYSKTRSYQQKQNTQQAALAPSPAIQSVLKNGVGNYARPYAVGHQLVSKPAVKPQHFNHYVNQFKHDHHQKIIPQHSHHFQQNKKFQGIHRGK